MGNHKSKTIRKQDIVQVPMESSSAVPEKDLKPYIPQIYYTSYTLTHFPASKNVGTSHSINNNNVSKIE